MNTFLFWIGGFINFAVTFFRAFVLFMGYGWFISGPGHGPVLPYYVFVFLLYSYMIFSLPALVATIMILKEGAPKEEDEIKKKVIGIMLGFIMLGAHIILLGTLYVLKCFLV